MPVRIRSFVFAPPAVPAFLASWVDALENHRGKDRFVWIDVEGEFGTEEEAILTERLGWHPTVIQNIRLPSSRPRFNPFEEYSHVTVHVLPPDAAAGDLRVRELDLVFSGDYLLSFHHEPISLVDQILADMPAVKTAPKSPDLLLHRILAASVEAIAPEVERMDDVIAALEEEALYHPEQDLLERIVHARDGLFLLHRSMAPQLQVVHDLTSGACVYVAPYALPFYKSLESRLRGLIDDLAIHKEMASSALELYRSAITHKTNEVIRVLTVVSTPLLVLSFLTGLYGMNVPLPFSGWPHVFTWMCIVALALFFGMLWWFKKREWV